MSFDGLGFVLVLLGLGLVLGFTLGRRSGGPRPVTLEPIAQRPSAPEAAPEAAQPAMPIPSLTEASPEMPAPTAAAAPEAQPTRAAAKPRAKRSAARSEPAAPEAAASARSANQSASNQSASADGSPRALLSAAQSWGYQLQHLDVARATASPFDVLVIDYAKDGSDDTALKPADLARLKVKSDGSRRIVLAYISIGEAESYRSYWQDEWKKQPPAWLLKENPDWEENYSVCFWDPEWQSLLCGSGDAYLDRILAQGFDGIYLDKCDVVDDLKSHEKKAAASRPDLNGDMVALVDRLARYARAKKPDFLVVMQNAEPLLERPELRALIDGVAKEELFYGLDAAERPNHQDEVDWSIKRLDLMRRDGKPVFVVEYLNDRAKIATAGEAIAKLGYVLYVSDKNRDLAKLNTGTAAA